jgi:HEAT repeat protein
MKFPTIILVLALLPAIGRASYVTDAVAQMPAKNPAAEAALAGKIMSGGVPAVKEVCSLLVPLGAEGKDDTAARYAVSALVRFAGRPGGENDRAALARGICDALGTTDDTELRTFFVNRLQEVGHDDVVPTLAPLLSDEKLAPHAAAALERIASPAAVEGLKKALPNAAGPSRVALVKSLGALRVADAAAEIRKSASDDDKSLRMAALWSLANIGDPAARELLGQAEKNTTSAYELANIRAWALLLIQRIAEGGKTQEAASYAIALLDETYPANVRSAAAALLARIEGEASLGTLLALAGKGDSQVRAAALQAAAAIPGEKVAAALTTRMASEERPELRAALLDALAARRDPSAAAVSAASVRDKDPSVRLAALRAVAALKVELLEPALMDRILTDTDPTVSKAAVEMLSRVPGESPLQRAAEALEKAPPKAKVALLEMLAGRAAKSHRQAVLNRATDEDAGVRLAALRAMEKLATDADAAALLARATEASDPGEESAALRAAVAAASQSGDNDRRLDPFLAALDKAKAPKRGAIERSLAKLGGKRAFDAVLADLKSTDANTKAGALEALAEWQDAAAVAPLLEVAKTDKDTNRQITAVRGVAQVLKAATSMPPADKAAAYAEAMSAARRPEDKKALLGALANERGRAFFDIAAAAHDDPALKAEAALAVIKIAVPQPRAQLPGLTGEDVAPALKKAIQDCPDANLRGDAQRYLNTLSKK